jgi:site-specific DNA-cytosine methylase
MVRQYSNLELQAMISTPIAGQDNATFFESFYAAIPEDLENLDEGSSSLNTISMPVSKRSKAQVASNAEKECIRQSVTLFGVEIRPGDTIELQPNDCKDKFLYVKKIVEKLVPTRSMGIFFQGFVIRRCKDEALAPASSSKTNEVIFVINSSSDQLDKLNVRTASEGLEEYAIDQCLRKRNLVITSDTYPKHSIRANCPVELSEEKQAIRETGQLCCRWLIGFGEESRNHVYPHTGLVRAITKDESDICDSKCQLNCPCQDKIDLIQLAFQTINYASAMSGAGGEVSGAIQAGAVLLFAFDKNSDAIKTLRINNPRSEGAIYLMDQEHFLHQFKFSKSKQCHVYHISFPCQPYSSANTRGKFTDRWYELAELSTAVGEHLIKVRPLVHTQENCPGLLHVDSREFFHSQVQDILKNGYNLQWKILDFQEYGLPASRKRLIIMASRHDLPLPTYPKPIYGPTRSNFLTSSGTTSRPCFQTIGDALRDFNAERFRHLFKRFDQAKRPYDAQKKYAGCLTTSGTTNYHPSGLRPFITPELALLQTFPQGYKFYGEKTSVTRQIGNAVPPGPWKCVVTNLIAFLKDYAIEKLKEQQSAEGFNSEDDDSLQAEIAKSVAIGNCPSNFELQTSKSMTTRTSVARTVLDSFNRRKEQTQGRILTGIREISVHDDPPITIVDVITKQHLVWEGHRVSSPLPVSYKRKLCTDGFVLISKRTKVSKDGQMATATQRFLSLSVEEIERTRERIHPKHMDSTVIDLTVDE